MQLSTFIDQIKHCAVGLLPVLFTGFPCTIKGHNPILPRPSQPEATPQLLLVRPDPLRPDGSITREFRTSFALASPRSWSSREGVRTNSRAFAKVFSS